MCEDTKMEIFHSVIWFFKTGSFESCFSFENFRQSDCLRLFKCIRRLFFLAFKIARI